MFQSTVNTYQGGGVPGEMYALGPHRAQSFEINSASAANNVIGTAMCTISSQGVCAVGNVGGTRQFAGLLVDPKNIALFGAGGIPLAPTLTVPNFTQVECATVGSYWVTLPTAAAIGDLVVYDNTTGAISTIAPGAALPAGKSFGYATVDYFTVTAAGLGVITLSPTLTIPAP